MHEICLLRMTIQQRDRIKMIGSPLKLSRTPVEIKTTIHRIQVNIMMKSWNRLNINKQSIKRGDYTMNFSFTEEQNMLRKTVRGFVDKEIMPHIGRMGS